MNEGNLPLRHVRNQSLPAMSTADEYYDNSWVPEVELREYWRVLVKYRLLIAAAIIAAILLAMIYAFTATPIYTAAVKLRIGTYEPILGATQVESMMHEQSKDLRYLETQIQEIKSLTLADRVLENDEIQTILKEDNKKGFFSNLFSKGPEEQVTPAPSSAIFAGYRHPLPELRSYLGRIEIKPIRKTALVLLEGSYSGPIEAALIANVHAREYVDWVRRVRVEEQSRGLTFLRGQAESLRQRVGDLEREIADYAEANSIVALNKDENIVVRKMGDLNKLLTEATADRIRAANIYKEALDSIDSGAGFDDSALQKMRSELADLESQYREMSEKFTPSYPRMRQLAARIEGLKSSIKAHLAQVARGLKARALAAQQEEETLREELEQQKSQAFELSKRQVQYNVLNRELTTSRELLQNVLRQIEETSLAAESNASNVSIVDHAVPPLDPSFPRKRLILMLALLIGLATGVGLAFLMNYLDNTIRTPEEVEAVLKLPSLGVVPSFEIESAGRLPEAENFGAASTDEPYSERIQGHQESLPTPMDSFMPIAFLDNPKGLAAEAYRTIRTGILLSQAGEPPRTLLVSSAQSSEGKTTSMINLAASLTGAGGRVVLIDADLRRPSVSRYFNLPKNLPGLVEVLTGQADLQEVTQRHLIKRLAIIPSGTIPPNPAELLASLEMATLIDTLAAQYDYVLIDCPPVLPVTDAVILSRYVDGVILVVRGGTTPRKVAADAKNRLLAVGARLLGVVLNNVDVTGGDYYYYNRYYYSYYDEDRDRSQSSPGTRNS